MNKKIYLDTSVISALFDERTPERMDMTEKAWEQIKKYDVYISDVVMAELMRCPEPKLSELLALLDEVRYTVIKVEGNAEVLALSAEIKKLNLIPPKSEDDRRHIAAALYSGCNIIVSWNFNHFVTEKTIDGVRQICFENHISPVVDIYSPTILLGRSDYNG